MTAPEQPAPAALTAAAGRATTVPDLPVTGAGVGVPRDADRVLARVADARVMAAWNTPARVVALAVVLAQTVTGMWLRGHLVVPSWQPLLAGCLGAAAWGVLLPWLSRWQGDPGWVPAAMLHERFLESRVPAPVLAIAARHASAARTRTGRETYLYVPTCTRPGRPHVGVCHLGGVVQLNGRLLIVLGGHLAAGSPEVAAGVLAREVAHLTSWRPALTYARTVLAITGPLVLGWTVPWPFLPAAIVAFIVVMTGASWVTEISCDRESARTGGPAGILGGLDYLGAALAADRAVAPAWRRTARSVVTWITGPPHPPLPLRRALVTTRASRRAGRPA